jgi:hypothetical protein
MYSKCSVPHLVNTPPLATSIEFFHINHAVSSMRMRSRPPGSRDAFNQDFIPCFWHTFYQLFLSIIRVPI